MNPSHFCRACALQVNEVCEIVSNPVKPDLPLLLQRYVPEFSIKVENAYLCLECVSTLYNFHNFKQKCLRTEENLRLYMRKHPEVKTINLNEIFAPREQTCVTGDVTGVVVKNEDVIKMEIMEPPEETITTTTPKEQKNNVPDDIELYLETTVIAKGDSENKTIEHLQTVTTNTVTATTQCDVIAHPGFPSKTMIQIPKRYRCGTCNRDFSSQIEYDKHVAYYEKTNVGSQNSVLDYDRISTVKKRNSSKDSTNEKKTLKLKCETCGKYVTRSVFALHVRRHRGETRYRCPVCKYTDVQISAVRAHARQKHDILDDIEVTSIVVPSV